MQLAKIAWRNLNRNVVRTLIAVLAIATVVSIVIFSRGLMVGFTESSFGMYIDNNFGHARITHHEYRVREALLPLDYTVNGFHGGGADEMMNELEALDIVEYVLPRIRFGTMASIDDDLVRMVGVGIDPSRESKHGALPGDINSGRMPEAGNEILVGRGLLKELGLMVNDRVTLVFSDAHQSIRGRTFEVVGVRESGVSELDNNFFYLPLETAQDMLWMENEVTEMLVFGPDARQAAALQSELDALMEERGAQNYYQAVSWNEADPFVALYDEVADVMNLVYILFILMGTVVIISTLTMIVRERTQEIGMMAALGLRGRDIMKAFVLEGTFMGLIGSLLGVVVGGLITFYYSINGLRVEAFADTIAGMGVLVEPVFYIAFNFENLIVSFALGVIIVALACFYPAYKAAKMEPVEALHFIDE